MEEWNWSSCDECTQSERKLYIETDCMFKIMTCRLSNSIPNPLLDIIVSVNVRFRFVN